MEHRLPVHRVGLGDLPERRLGLRQGALLLVRRPKEEAHLPVSRLGRENEGELVDRVVEPVAIEVKKSQFRADVEVGGGELLQLLVLAHRLVDLLLPDQQPAEPVPEERVVRGSVERLLVPFLRLRVPAKDLENRAGLDERRVEARGDREGLVVVDQGLRKLLLGRKDAAPVIVRQVGIGVPGDQRAENFLGLGKLPPLRVEGGDVEVRVIVLRVLLQDTVVLGQGLFAIARRGEDPRQKIPRPRVPPVHRQSLFQFLPGLGEPPLLHEDVGDLVEDVRLVPGVLQRLPVRPESGVEVPLPGVEISGEKVGVGAGIGPGGVRAGNSVGRP